MLRLTKEGDLQNAARRLSSIVASTRPFYGAVLLHRGSTLTSNQALPPQSQGSLSSARHHLGKLRHLPPSTDPNVPHMPQVVPHQHLPVPSMHQ